MKNHGDQSRPHSLHQMDEWSDIGHLFELLQPPAWHKDAACKEHPEVNFFPERHDGKAVKAAIEVCKGCLVATECYEAGLKEPIGVWGGKSAFFRKKARSTGNPRPKPVCGTRGGFEAHRRRKETPCQDCRDALNAYNRWLAAQRKERPDGLSRAEYMRFWRARKAEETGASYYREYRARMKAEALQAAKEWGTA